MTQYTDVTKQQQQNLTTNGSLGLQNAAAAYRLTQTLLVWPPVKKSCLSHLRTRGIKMFSPEQSISGTL